MALTARVSGWAAIGERLPVAGGHELFVTRRAGAGPALLLLHGFPSSSYDWRGLLEQSAIAGREVLAFDFLGFGLSDKPAGGPYSLMTQADLTEELVARFCRDSVFIVAHDMGTSVATELFARAIEGRAKLSIAGALLFNGSMLLHLARPTVGQRLLRGPLGPLAARLSSERFFRQQLGSVFSPAHPLSAEEAEDQWSLLTCRGGQRRGHELIAYMDERDRYTERWHGAIRDWPGELSLLWGLRDPVARVEVLRGIQELRPGVPVSELPELGHYPQIEDPRRVSDVVAAAIAPHSPPTA